MSVFSSYRERRLWGWALAVVAAIYSTLGLAPAVARVLKENGLLGAGLFVIASLLVLASVVTQGLRVRPSGVEIAVALGVAAAYLMLFLRISIPAERSHLIEYGVVAVLVHEALTERRAPLPALLAVLVTSVLGALDEGIQKLLPNRTFEWVDILFNVLAAVMSVGASLALSWARNRLAARPPTPR